MTQLFRISKAGNDVLGTSTNPDDYIFSSSYNTLKYYQAGSISLTVGSVSSGTIIEGTAAHNLGYFPFYQAYINISGSANYYPASYGSSAGGGNNFIAQAYISTANIYFKIDTNYHNSTTTYVMYYKIFKNNLGY